MSASSSKCDQCSVRGCKDDAQGQCKICAAPICGKAACVLSPDIHNEGCAYLMDKMARLHDEGHALVSTEMQLAEEKALHISASLAERGRAILRHKRGNIRNWTADMIDAMMPLFDDSTPENFDAKFVNTFLDIANAARPASYESKQAKDDLAYALGSFTQQLHYLFGLVRDGYSVDLEINANNDSVVQEAVTVLYETMGSDMEDIDSRLSIPWKSSLYMYPPLPEADETAYLSEVRAAKAANMGRALEKFVSRVMNLKSQSDLIRSGKDYARSFVYAILFTGQSAVRSAISKLSQKGKAVKAYVKRMREGAKTRKGISKEKKARSKAVKEARAQRMGQGTFDEDAAVDNIREMEDRAVAPERVYDEDAAVQGLSGLDLNSKMVNETPIAKLVAWHKPIPDDM